MEQNTGLQKQGRSFTQEGQAPLWPWPREGAEYLGRELCQAGGGGSLSERQREDIQHTLSPL